MNSTTSTSSRGRTLRQDGNSHGCVRPNSSGDGRPSTGQAQIDEARGRNGPMSANPMLTPPTTRSHPNQVRDQRPHEEGPMEEATNHLPRPETYSDGEGDADPEQETANTQSNTVPREHHRGGHEYHSQTQTRRDRHPRQRNRSYRPRRPNTNGQGPPALPDEELDNPSSELGNEKAKRQHLTIATLNMNGGGSYATKRKWKSISKEITASKIGILALQETHTDDLLSQELIHNYSHIRGIASSSDPESPTARNGVSIWINRRVLRTENMQVWEIIPGRAIMTELTWKEGVIVRILNVYAPTHHNENQTFWENLKSKWESNNEAEPNDGEEPLPKPNIVLGDFNIVESAFDRLPNRTDPRGPVQALESLMNLLELSDGWRHLYPEPRRDFTYNQSKTQDPSRSRIDRIYLSDSFLNNTERWITSPQTYSDHSMLQTNILTPSSPTLGKGRWQLPIHLTKNDAFMRKIQTRIIEALQSTETRMIAGEKEVTPMSELMNITRFIQKEAKSLSYKTIANISNLTKDTRKALQSEITKAKADPESQNNIILLKHRLKDLESKKDHYLTTATRAKDRAFGEKSTRWWSVNSKEATPRDLIECLHIRHTGPEEGGATTHDSSRMAKEMALHHEHIQVDQTPPDENARAINIAQHMETITPSPDLLSNLGDAFTWDEVKDAIRKAPDLKAPGIDGIPSEMYKELLRRCPSQAEPGEKRADITELLRRVFEQIRTTGESCKEFNEGWLAPIYKDKGDRKDPVNYRPITVLNSTYKIYTTSLMGRLTEVADKIIHPSQAGFIKGRHIADHTRLADLIGHYCEVTGQEGMIVALDQEKAYDKIKHDYLWETLNTFGCPESFVRQVQALYRDAYTRVMVNGELSEPFQVQRGVRQGDPLSCILFNLAIEPLANKIRESLILKGLSTKDAENKAKRIIITLFADDTTVFLDAKDAWEDLKELLDGWCIAAGAKFNEEKTAIILLGPLAYRERTRNTRQSNPLDPRTKIPDHIKIIPEGASEKILGIQIGSNHNIPGRWSKTISKVAKATNAARNLFTTAQGRTIMAQRVIGGMTQYMTDAIGMPEETQKELIKATRKIFWDSDSRSAPIGINYAQLKQNSGGWNLIDIEARNEAILLMNAKRLLDFSPNRPTWVDIAHHEIRLAIPKSEIRWQDENIYKSIFLQAIWKQGTFRSPALHPHVRDMLKALHKANLKLDPTLMTDKVKGSMPAWLHYGTTGPNGPRLHSKKSICLRETHGVWDVDGLLLLKQAYNSPDHICRRSCKCPACEDAQEAGCTHPDKCYAHAIAILQNINTAFIPDLEVSSHTERPDDPDDGSSRSKNEEWVMFERPEPKASEINQCFTIMSGLPTTPQILTEGYNLPRPGPRPGLTTIYTDGSSQANGRHNARAGAGVWFGTEDPRNTALRVPNDLPQTNNTGELLAILEAARITPSNDTLAIISDSTWAIKSLTKWRENNERKGYTETANSDLIQCTVDILANRRGTTFFRWIKGHSGAEGNEGADTLAGEGAEKPDSLSANLAVRENQTHKGIHIVHATQSLLYRAVWNKRNPTKGDRADNTILRVQEIAANSHDSYPSTTDYWKLIIKDETISRNVRTFLWRASYNSLRIGKFWAHIPGHEFKANCKRCQAPENLSHIMFTCPDSQNTAIWNRANELITQSGHTGPTDPNSLEDIMAYCLATPEDKETKKKTKALRRLARILVTEAAFQIWKLRNEVSVGGKEQQSTQAALGAYNATITSRIKDDILMTNTRIFENKALDRSLVLDTWRKILRHNNKEPEEWSDLQAGVLVGSTGRRPRGRHR